MSIEEYIRKSVSSLLNRTKLSASELSRRSGHGKSYISNILSGNSLPTYDSLASMCKASGISLSDFFAEYEQRDSEILTEIRRLFTPEEEKKLCLLLKKADRDSADLLFQVLDHVSEKSKAK